MHKGSGITKTLGFVLKRFLPLKAKFSLFTATQGKVELVCSSQQIGARLWPGTLISCDLEQGFYNSRVYIGNNVEIIHLPVTSMGLHLEWIHHILELCYYFLLPCDPHANVFVYLERVFFLCSYEPARGWITEDVEHIFVSYLLTLFGFMPPKALNNYIILFEKELFLSVDSPKKMTVESIENIVAPFDTGLRSLMEAWILDCLTQHPSLKSFKTFKALI